VALLLLTNGRSLGVSGILSGLLDFSPGDTAWRVGFVGGLMSGGLLLLAFYPQAFAMAENRSLAATGIAGLLVGFGARLGGGCTSGHGVCGIGRLSPRSIVATLMFMGTGILTVLIINRFLGGSL
jgi:uncharacterized membrane protein YedE/YeeE